MSWFELDQGRVRRTQVKPEDSFLLGLLRAGIAWALIFVLLRTLDAARLRGQADALHARRA